MGNSIKEMITLGSQSQLGIGIAIRLQDQFSGTAAKVASTLQSLKNQAQSAVVSSMRNYRNNAAAISAAAAGATIGMYKLTQAGAEFQHKINQVAIVGGRELGRSRKQLAGFAQDLSKTFTRSPTEIAGAMFENVKAGLTKGLDNITKYQIAVATATDEMLEGEQGVAFGLISIMNAMDMSYGQFPRIANAVTAAANASQASVSSLNESMQYFANTAHLAGLNLEETLTLIAKLSQSGIRGSGAGTALSNMLNYVFKNVGPFRSKKANKAWAMLGIDPKQVEAMANAGHIFDVLALIDQGSKRLNTTDKKSALNALLNIRGERALENLFGNADPNKTLEGLKKSIIEGVQSDVAIRQSHAMMDDLQGEMGKLSNSFRRFGIAFTTAVGPTLRVMISFLTRITQFGTAILQTPIGKVFAGLAVVVVPLIGIMFALRAAALTAAIALNGFAMTSRVGGFSNLLGAGLGMWGSSSLASKGIGINKAGRSFVKAGETISIGGKLYKGGQILPGGFQAASGAAGWMGKIGNFLGLGALAGGMGWGAKLAGFAGKALPWLGRLVSFGFKWIPVIGWIWTIVDILNSIFGIFDSKQRDPVKDYYQAQLYNKSTQKYFGDEYKVADPYNAWVAKHGGKDNILQTLNINIDGKKAISDTIEHKFQDSMNNQLNFNLIH